MLTFERLNCLADLMNVHRYLEIGVQKGKTFLRLDFPYKVAVDPTFRFDTTPHSNDSTEFHEITSDAYFQCRPESSAPFDLIFIDGLHTFEQSLRDLNNALSVSHENTLIVLDDVFPNDVYSSRPEGSHFAAGFRRRLHGSDDPRWHGDVYKTLMVIHDFYPGLSYCTTSPQVGNPQAYIYKKPRQEFQPEFGSLSDIVNLDFFELQNHLDLYHFMPESELFDHLRKVYESRNR